MGKILGLSKYFIVILLIMSFLFISFSNLNSVYAAKKDTSTKYDYVIIGDSRTVGMYNAFTGSSLTVVKKATTIDDKKVMFLGATSQGYTYWFNNPSKNNNYTDILTALNNTKEGGRCYIWLGVNDCGYPTRPTQYANAVGKLAKKYKNIRFVYISVGAVNQNRYKGPAKNSVINLFNSSLKLALKTQSRYGKNLYYKNIRGKNITIGKTTKTFNHWVVDDATYATDGLHYGGKNGILYKEIYKLMIS